MRRIWQALRDRQTAGETWYRIGIVAATLLVVGSGWYQLLTVPPYYAADEQAHVGYVLSLEAGRLPTIDTPIDGDSGGEDLRQQLARSRQRQQDVWVANNPPLAYVVALPAATVSQALGLPGGPLLGLRVTNLAAFAVAVVYVGRLGRRLFGDDPAIGLGAAALFAAVPHVGAISGAGFVDGLALLCSVAIADGLVGMARSGVTRRGVITLAVWCAAGAAVRPMTAVVAALAAGMAWAMVVLQNRQGRADEGDEPGVGWSLAVLAGPAALTSGWFYLRNQSLYGDPTASDALFAKFTRVERGGRLSELLRSEVWADPVRTLLNRRLPQDLPSSPLWLWGATRWIVAGLVGVAIVLLVTDVVRSRRAGIPVSTSAGGPLAVAVLCVASIGLAAQHWLGGGNIHPRYLFLPLVVVVALVAGAAATIGRRVALVGLVAAVLAIQGVQVPRQNRSLPRPGWDLLPPSSALTEPTGPHVLRLVGVLVVVAGFAAWALAVWGTARTERRD